MLATISNYVISVVLGGSLICYFDKKHIFKLFVLSSCQYVSAIPEKIACYRPFKNRHFVRVCTEKMIDHQYRENCTRDIYLHYNQMRAYVECSPNQFQKIILYSTFPSSNRRNFENSGKVLAVSVSEFHQSMVLFHVCKHIRYEGIALPTSLFNF